MKTLHSPWMKFHDAGTNDLDVPDISMYDMLKSVAVENPSQHAYNYFGTVVSYGKFLQQIDKAADAFRRYGVEPGDSVTVCLPNFPEGIVCVYALNKIGAIANMVHPLSGEEEIKKYVNNSNSKIIITRASFKTRFMNDF